MSFRGEEDYIKHIFQLQCDNPSSAYVKTSELIQLTGHAAPSVNEMIKRLVSKGLLEYNRYVGVRLTSEGEHIAANIIKKHRLWETFLHDYLNYKWDEIHDEAEALEHITSDRLSEALYAFMAHPKTCPHGNPIEVSIDDQHDSEEILLINASTHHAYRIIRVKDTPDVLEYLDRIQLKPGTTIRINENDPFNELIEIKNDDRTKTIGYRLAKSIVVKKLD